MTATRRPKGSGTYNEKRQRWETTITVGRVDGRQVRKKVTGRTQKELAARKAELLAAVSEGRELKRRDLTVGGFLSNWLDNVLPGTVARATEDQYRQIVRLYVEPAVGHKNLRTLQPADVTRMIRNMDDRGLSTNSQRLARAVLRRALRSAEVEGVTNRNVAALAYSPKVQSSEGKSLSPAEARSLLEYLADTGDDETGEPTPHRLEAAFAVALSLGLRRGEVLGLAWSDLELDRSPATLTVRNAVKRHQGRGLVLEPPKTRQSRRTVHLPAPAVDALRRHRARQAAERLAAGEFWTARPLGADLVFRTEAGDAIDPNNFGRAVRAACKDAGITGSWSPHSLRHSAASLLLAQGVPLKVVSEVLGHSSIRVTADVYSHLMEPAKAEAADAMTAALWGEA